MLTRAQVTDLGTRLRRIRGRCLQKGLILDEWLKENPDVDPCDARYLASCAVKSPFPPIDGPNPTYRDRPFYDIRFEGEWSDDNG